MNHARDGLCVASDEEYIYAISGYDGNRYLNSVERYDPTRDVWELEGYYLLFSSFLAYLYSMLV